MDESKKRRLVAQLANDRYKLLTQLENDLLFEEQVEDNELDIIVKYLQRKKKEAYELAK